MPEIKVKGSDRTLKIDAKYAKMLPASVWVDAKGYRTPVPRCRLNGRVVTVVRFVGLTAGLDRCRYILPKNGDQFDCRRRNVASMCDVPAETRAVKKSSKTGIKGIRPYPNGRFLVVVGEKRIGVAPDLNSAVVMLNNAR